jgi:hypothetical protein
MRKKLADAMKQAMLDKEAARLSTIRLIHAAIKDKDIEARTEDTPDGVSDEAILGILGTMIKQRQESARMYEEAGRLELGDAERAEIKVIQEFLPKQLSDQEVEEAIDDAIKSSGADSIRDMGKVMEILKSKYTGRMDFSKVGAAIKSRLM